MTRAHIVLKKWIEKNFVMEDIQIEFPDSSSVTITDRIGESMTVTLNLFCDIIEADTGKILAISNLPHDILKVGYALPKTWEELPYK